MHDTTTDLIGSQTFAGRKFCPTCNFKIMEFFFYIQRCGTPNYVEVIYCDCTEK